MGMFDHVEVECELPIPDFVPLEIKDLFKQAMHEDGFQTKDFDRLLQHYRIGEDNKLYKRNNDWFVDTEVIDEGDPVDFHGIMEIHTIVYLDDSNLIDTAEYFGIESNGHKMRSHGPKNIKNWLYLSYNMKFTDGILVKITMNEPIEKDLSDLNLI